MADSWASAPAASPLDVALDAEGSSPQVAALARSVYQQESGGGSNTKTSNQGAVGGMQIKQGTFDSVADKGWNINDPVDNARAGVRYLQQMHDKADGDPALAAAGYYGGPSAIDKAKKGIAVSDPKNPNAPNTLQYGQQVAARAGADAASGPAWASAPVVGQSSDGSNAQPGGTPGDPSGDTGGGAWSHILSGVGNAIMHPIDTAENLGNKAVDTVTGFGKQYLDNPLAATEGLVRGVADAATFGYGDKIAAGFNTALHGGTEDDYNKAVAAERAKDAAAGPAFNVGQVGGAFIPGLGQVGMVGHALEAVPTASRVAKIAAGAGAGAAEGVANYAGHNDGALNASDASAYGTLGALGGSVAGAINPHTGDQMAGSFTKAAQDYDPSLHPMIAEVAKDLKDRAASATQGNAAFGAPLANAVASKYTADAADALRLTPKTPERQTLLNALNRPKALDDADIAALRQLPNGDAVADAIQKHQLALAMTSATPANNRGLLPALRMGVDNGLLGMAGTAFGHPIIGTALNTNAVRGTVNRLLGGRESRMGNAGAWIGQADNAEAYLNKFGPSSATGNLQGLQQAGQQTVQQAAAQAQAQQAARQAAQSQAAQKAAANVGPQITPAQWQAGQQRQAAQVGPQLPPQAAQAIAAQKAAAQVGPQATASQIDQAARATAARQAAAQVAAQRQEKAAAQIGPQITDSQWQAGQQRQAAQIGPQLPPEAQQAIAAQQAAAQIGPQATPKQIAQATQASQAAAQQAAAQRQQALAAQQALNAKANQAAAARINAQQAARASATAVPQEAEAAAQAASEHVSGVSPSKRAQANLQAVKNGDFSGLDFNKPQARVLLAHLGNQDPAAIKTALTQLAKEDPDTAIRAIQTLTPDHPNVKFYGAQKALQEKHGLGSRSPSFEELAAIPGTEQWKGVQAAKAAQASGQTPGALSGAPGMSLEDAKALAKYQGGIDMRLQMAKEARAAATDPEVQKLIDKVRQIPDDKGEIPHGSRAEALNAFLSKTKDPEKVLEATRLVTPLVTYGR